MGDRPPAPICAEEVNACFIDDGTMCLWQSNAPAPSGPGPVPSDVTGRICEAMERSIPLLPGEVGSQISAMLSPQSILIVVSTLVLWAGSHFFGVGEIVDVILLVIGFAFLGAGVWTGAQQLYDFATSAIHAHSDADLDRAAHHFASAVSILGITVVTALLLRRSMRAVRARPAKPLDVGLLEVDPPPPPGQAPTITRPPSLASGALGETDWYGSIQVARNQSLSEQRITLYHEWVHSVLSPRIAPLRQLRASLRASAYWRSALMRYLEEAMAEGWAQLRAQGLAGVVTGIRFPLLGPTPYVTITQLASEGTAIGNITLGGAQFTVYVSDGGDGDK